MASTPPAASPSGVVRAFLALCLMAGWTALLVGPVPPARGWHAVVRFAPLGFVAVFAFADRGLRLTRVLFVALPAFLLGLVGAGLVLWIREKAAGYPGPSDLLVPGAGLALGIAIGLAWRRGPLALLLLPFKAAIAASAIALLGVVLLVVFLDKTPTVAEAARAETAPEGRAPAGRAEAAPPGLPAEGGTLRLEGADLERLLVRGWPVPLRRDRARLAVAVEADGRLRISSSLLLPWISRWLNGAASARVSVRDGELELQEPRLRLAGFELSRPVLRVLAPALTLAIRAERPVRRILPAIRDLHAEAGALLVTLGSSR
jgi:hypothetical protein